MSHSFTMLSDAAAPSRGPLSTIAVMVRSVADDVCDTVSSSSTDVYGIGHRQCAELRDRVTGVMRSRGYELASSARDIDGVLRATVQIGGRTRMLTFRPRTHRCAKL